MLPTALILLAAGESSRFKVPVKKQWLRIDDKPLWKFVLDKFVTHYNFDEVIIVGHKDEIEFISLYCDYKVVAGGNTRQESLKNGVEATSAKYVLISDIARCCIPKDMIFRILNYDDSFDCIVPYLPTPDTTLLNDSVIDRNSVKLIQTPQLSNRSFLLKALTKTDKEFTDESTLIKHFGGKIAYVLGDEKAKKLTFSNDTSHITCLKSPSKDFFIGNGFDVHEFENNKKMFLCGVEISSSYGFKAHSDGDVALHALMDAIYGAAGLGDLGEWFPDNDNKYKNIDSKILLNETIKRVNQFGFEIVNVDLTIIAQTPRLKEYKTLMRKSLNSILKISIERINIKATTTENLGFIGRKEGVGVIATATLKYFDWTKNESSCS